MLRARFRRRGAFRDEQPIRRRRRLFKSLEAAYEAVRARRDAGGAGWRPNFDTSCCRAESSPRGAAGRPLPSQPCGGGALFFIEEKESEQCPNPLKPN